VTFERSIGKNVYIALRRSTFLKGKTNPSRYQIQLCIWAN